MHDRPSNLEACRKLLRRQGKIYSRYFKYFFHDVLTALSKHFEKFKYRQRVLRRKTEGRASQTKAILFPATERCLEEKAKFSHPGRSLEFTFIILHVFQNTNSSELTLILYHFLTQHKRSLELSIPRGPIPFP